MIRDLPLFPLNLVAFPGEELRLHIFEPRYKQLIHDTVAGNSSFGIPTYFDGAEMKYGTEVVVDKIVKTYVGGELDIIVRGIGWFEVIDFQKIMYGKLYPCGTVEVKEWIEEFDIVISAQIVDRITTLYRIMSIDNVKIPEAKDFRSWSLVHKIGLSREQEIELLNIPHELDKCTYLLTFLDNLIPIVTEAENIRKRAELNGHFQHFKPNDF
jgi:ATP-dependent Lon protease